MRNTDLHTHSYYSDGELSPRKVVRIAKRARIKYLALADHNSVEGVEEAIKEGKKIGVYIIPAVEIRAKEDEVLGYFINHKNKELKKEIKRIENNVYKRAKKIISKLNKKGIEVKFSDLVKRYHLNKNLMEIHIVRYLKEKGYGEIRELWNKYISRGGETYVPIKEISVINSIKLIKKYGGIPVLSHPWVEQSSKAILKEENFKKLIKAGLKGIEIDNGDRDKRRDKKTLKNIKRLAKKYNLIITSGSDFHKNKSTKSQNQHQIGKCNCDEKVVNKLRELKQSN